jgi:hypothetical protein
MGLNALWFPFSFGSKRASGCLRKPSDVWKGFFVSGRSRSHSILSFTATAFAGARCRAPL